MVVRIDDSISSQVREVTDDEVEFYLEHGWVMLRGIVPPELAVRMREVAVSTGKESFLSLKTPAIEGIEPFQSVVLSPLMGRNAELLSGRARLGAADVRMRYHHDYVSHKGPAAPPTLYHQDATEEGPDRTGGFTIWLALDEVTPEMGAMRFLSGVHREGPLGLVDDILPVESEGADTDAPLVTGVLRRFPRLPEIYEVSPPFYYGPGDATVHHAYMVHGGPANTTEMSRWNYQFGYMPADTRYVNGDPIRPRVDRVEVDDASYPVVTSDQV